MGKLSIRSRAAAVVAIGFLVSPPYVAAQAVGEGEARKAGASGTEAEAVASPDELAGWEADDSAGFAPTQGTPAQDMQADPDPEPAPTPWVLSGFGRTTTGLWMERLRERPLASARGTLQLDLAYRESFAIGGLSGSASVRAVGRGWYDLVYPLDPGAFDEPTREAYEWGVMPRELLAALTLGPVRVSVGRQVVNWGQSEALTLLDLVNPRDFREPGLVPPEEVRFPVAMSKLELSMGAQRIEALVVHEVSFGLLPAPLSPFNPLRALLLETPALGASLAAREVRFAHLPDEAWFNAEAQQYHARWSHVGSGFDIALHGASMLEPLGVPVLPDPAVFADERVELSMVHPRFELLGLSLAVPWGSFLLRAEAAVSFARPLALRRSGTALLELSSTRRHQLDGLAGLTYVAGENTSLGLEVAQSYVVDNPQRQGSSFAPLWPVEATRSALRIDHALLHQRLRFRIVVLRFGALQLNAWGGLAEVGLSLVESLRASLQYATYHPTGAFGPFYGFRDHDRLVLTLRWDLST